MDTPDTSIQFLRKIIQNEVFITKDKETISPENSRWLFDFRRVSLQPQFLKYLGDIFIKKFEKDFPFQIGGVEVAGIPILAGLAILLHEKNILTNGFFIRKSRKKSGLLRMIEGSLNNEKVILIDDLLNTGSSLIRQVEIMESLGKKVHAVFVILRFRDMEYYTYFHDRGIKIESIFCLDDFNNTLKVKNLVHSEKTPMPTPFEKKWYFKSEGANFFYVIPKSRPVLDETNLYLGSDAGVFWALSQKDGSVVWSFKVGLTAKGAYIFSSPLIYDGFVFFGAHDGNFYALNTKTGKQSWVFFEADWIQSSPALSKKHNFLLIGLEFGLWKKEGGIVALDMKTGTKIWEYRAAGRITSSPAYSEKFDMVVCGSSNHTLYALSGKDGTVLWQFRTGEKITSKPAFEENSKRIVFTSNDGYIYIVRTEDGELLYKIETAGWPYSDVTIHEGIAYIATLAKILYAINIKTGEILWEFEAKARIFATPVIVDTKLYIGSNDARLYELDLKSGKETGFFQATERITDGIAYNQKTGDIFLPTFANEVYCLKKTIKN